ncbi:MAG: hypothetical protein LBK67_02305 [Coriobacteriales bacterium]|nr:hypothetical protein [Coriobacteriales bacterium]
MDEATIGQLRALVREAIVEQLGVQAAGRSGAGLSGAGLDGAERRGTEVLDGIRPLDITKDPSGFAVIRGAQVQYETFDTGKPGDKVTFRQLLTSEESPRLAFGFLDIEKSSFDWFLGYDEVDYILRGTWEITINNRKYVGHAGDTMFIPKNTAVTFGSPDHATVFYTAYPANWEELCEEQPPLTLLPKV